MPRDNRPPQQICPTCRGKARVPTPRQRRDKDGTVTTETVMEDCKGCGGVGWVNR